MASVRPLPQRRAFALAELCIVVGIALAIVCLTALAGGDSRRRARLAASTSNLTILHDGYASFAADNANRIASFTWHRGEVHQGFPVAATDNEAATYQAVEILRRLAHRPELQPITAGTWTPHPLYNHLPVADHLQADLPAPWFVSPGDTIRLAWQRDPRNFETLASRPAVSGNDAQRWPYSSSYEIGPAFVSPDAQVSTPQGQIPTIQQDFNHRQYQTGNERTVLGSRQMSEVRFPSQKAMIYETVQRFFGNRQLFFMYVDARVPVLCADGAVTVRAGQYANSGFMPNSPTIPAPTQVNYMPDTSWEPPTRNGAASQVVNGSIRWTRSGLRGRDFAGSEVAWVP